MNPTEALEVEVKALLDAGQDSRAVASILESFGRKLFGFIFSLSHDEELSSEGFSEFTEDLCRGIGGFEWRCPLESWLYSLARHAAIRVGKAAGRRRKRSISLADAPEVAAVEARVRTETLGYLKTTARGRLTELRDTLSVEDRSLLLMRVDRNLSWLELARVSLEKKADSEADLTQEQLDREAARLRKRFQLVKTRLQRLAKAENLRH